MRSQLISPIGQMQKMTDQHGDKGEPKSVQGSRQCVYICTSIGFVLFAPIFFLSYRLPKWGLTCLIFLARGASLGPAHSSRFLIMSCHIGSRSLSIFFSQTAQWVPSETAGGAPAWVSFSKGPSTGLPYSYTHFFNIFLIRSSHKYG